MPAELLLPKDKHDITQAEVLVALGFPQIEPILPEILEWVQDMNWPVARIFQPFLSAIGAPLAPFIRVVLFSDDETWKYFVIGNIVGESMELARALRAELERLATAPTESEIREQVHEQAAEVLRKLSDGKA